MVTLAFARKSKKATVRPGLKNAMKVRDDDLWAAAREGLLFMLKIIGENMLAVRKITSRSRLSSLLVCHT